MVGLWLAPAQSAECTVRSGDNWTRIAKKVSAPILQYKPGTLVRINNQIGELRPGQQVIYLSLSEISQAKKWIELCNSAGFGCKTYDEDLKNLSSRKIQETAVKRLVNYAEAYRLGVKPGNFNLAICWRQP